MTTGGRVFGSVIIRNITALVRLNFTIQNGNIIQSTGVTISGKIDYVIRV